MILINESIEVKIEFSMSILRVFQDSIRFVGLSIKNTTLMPTKNSLNTTISCIGWWFMPLKSLLELACEPSAAQVTKSYSRRLPALERFYRETKFSKFRY